MRNGVTNPTVFHSAVDVNEYLWNVSGVQPSTNVQILVSDDAVGGSGYAGISEAFTITNVSSIRVISPAKNELWPVDTVQSISWAKGGTMTNSWIVNYIYGGMRVNVITNQFVPYDSTNNNYSLPWRVENVVGPVRFEIINAENDSIRTISEQFEVVGQIQLISPSPGSLNYAAHPQDNVISWNVWGAVSAFDLEYSTDQLHATWKTITNNYVITLGPTLLNVGQFTWVTPAFESDTVKIRVRQSTQRNNYDDTDGDFKVSFYEVTWHVYDRVSTSNLTLLTVSDSSGWSESSLRSPQTHRYPYPSRSGYDTVWVRPYYYDAVVFDWRPSPGKVIDVPMDLSEVDPTYQVLGNFAYDFNQDSLTIHAWLERGGRALPDPQAAVVYMYGLDGSAVTNITMSLTASASAAGTGARGVYKHVWGNVTDTNAPVHLDRNQVYFARIEITYSGVRYDSVLTYEIRLAAEQDTVQQIKNALADATDSITNRIAGVSNLFNRVHNQGLWTSNHIAWTSNQISRLTQGTNSLMAQVSNLVGTVEGVSNALNVTILPAVTNLAKKFDPLDEKVTWGLSRILTRPDAVSYGSTNRILYKTRTGLPQNPVIYVPHLPLTAEMTQVMDGLYEYYPLVADWGTNSYVVRCEDQDGLGGDQIWLNVVGGTLYDVPRLLAGIESDLFEVRTNVLDMAAVLEGVDTLQNLADLSTNLTPLVNALKGLDATAISNLNVTAALMPEVLRAATNTEMIVASIEGVSNLVAAVESITNLQQIVNSMEGLKGLETNVQSLVDSFQGVNFRMLGTQMLDVVTSVNSLTNLNTLGAQITNLVAITTELQGLRTLETNVADLVTTFKGVDLTGFGTAMTNLTDAVRDASVLTNLAGITAQVTNLANVVNNMQDLTGLQTSVSNLANALDIDLAQFASTMSNLTLAVGQANVLTNLPGVTAQITNLAAIVGNMQDLSGLQTSVSNLALALNFDLREFAKTMTNMTLAVDNASVLTNLAGITAQVTNLANVVNNMQDLGGLQASVSNLASALNLDLREFAKTMTNMTLAVDNASVLTNLHGIVGQVTNLANVVNNLKNLDGLQDSVLEPDVGAELGSVRVCADDDEHDAGGEQRLDPDQPGRGDRADHQSHQCRQQHEGPDRSAGLGVEPGVGAQPGSA